MFFHIEVVLTHFDLMSCRKHSLCGGSVGEGLETVLYMW